MESKDTERQLKEVAHEHVEQQPAKDKPADGRRRYTPRARTAPITSPGIVVASGGILDVGGEWESAQHLHSWLTCAGRIMGWR